MEFVNDLTTGKTIDIERDAVLSIDGHDRENNYAFMLEMESLPVRFSAQYSLLPDGGGQATLSWAVSNLIMPAELKEKKELVCSLIADALGAHGLLQMKKNIKKINITFLSSI